MYLNVTLVLFMFMNSENKSLYFDFEKLQATSKKINLIAREKQMSNMKIEDLSVIEELLGEPAIWTNNI